MKRKTYEKNRRYTGHLPPPKKAIKPRILKKELREMIEDLGSMKKRMSSCGKESYNKIRQILDLPIIKE